MVCRSLVVLILASACATQPALAGDVEEGLRPLQGAWKPVRLERGGAVVKDAFAADARFVVAGRQMVLRAGGRDLQELRLHADAGRKPATLDLTSVSGPTAGQVLHAIYRVEGGHLLLCWSVAGNDRRPADFGGGGADETTVTLERE